MKYKGHSKVKKHQRLKAWMSAAWTLFPSLPSNLDHSRFRLTQPSLWEAQFFLVDIEWLPAYCYGLLLSEKTTCTKDEKQEMFICPLCGRRNFPDSMCWGNRWEEYFSPKCARVISLEQWWWPVTKIHHMIMYFRKENTTHFHLNVEEGVLLKTYKPWNTSWNYVWLQRFSFGICYTALLRFLLFNNFFFLLLPSTMSL